MEYLKTAGVAAVVTVAIFLAVKNVAPAKKFLVG